MSRVHRRSPRHGRRRADRASVRARAALAAIRAPASAGDMAEFCAGFPQLYESIREETRALSQYLATKHLGGPVVFEVGERVAPWLNPAEHEADDGSGRLAVTSVDRDSGVLCFAPRAHGR